MNKLTVLTTKLKNVYDKEQLYLIITDGETKVVINVGNKTWDAVTNLLNPVDIKPQNEQKNKKEVIK